MSRTCPVCDTWVNGNEASLIKHVERHFTEEDQDAARATTTIPSISYATAVKQYSANQDNGSSKMARSEQKNGSGGGAAAVKRERLRQCPVCEVGISEEWI